MKTVEGGNIIAVGEVHAREGGAMGGGETTQKSDCISRECVNAK